LPLGEQTGLSIDQSCPPPLEPLEGPQLPILLPSPASQVGADALEEGLRETGRVARVGAMLTVFLSDQAGFAAFHRRLREAGVLIAPSQDEAWFVSIAHTDEDVQRTLEAAR